MQKTRQRRRPSRLTCKLVVGCWMAIWNMAIRRVHVAMALDAKSIIRIEEKSSWSRGNQVNIKEFVLPQKTNCIVLAFARELHAKRQSTSTYTNGLFNSYSISTVGYSTLSWRVKDLLKLVGGGSKMGTRPQTQCFIRCFSAQSLVWDTLTFFARNLNHNHS